MSINREIVNHVIEDSESSLASRVVQEHLIHFLFLKGIIKKEEYLTSLNTVVSVIANDPSLKEMKGGEGAIERLLAHVDEHISRLN